MKWLQNCAIYKNGNIGVENMTDRELLEAIYNDMQLMKAETKSLQDDMKTTKEEMQSMKGNEHVNPEEQHQGQ